MDKNTIIGFVLIAAVIIGFTLLSRPSAEELAKQKEQYRRDSIEYAQTKEREKELNDLKDTAAEVKNENPVDDFFATPVQETDSVLTAMDSVQMGSQQAEQLITLENSKLKVVFSTKGGKMVSAQLKEYSRYDGDSLYLFNNDAEFSLQLTNKQNKVLHTNNLIFTPIKTEGDNSLIMRFSYAANQHVDFIYKLAEDDYMLKYDVNLVGLQPMLDRNKSDVIELYWAQKMRRQEKSVKNEQRYSHIYYKYIGGDVKELSSDKSEQLEVKEPAKWVAFKNQFFAPILIADEKIDRGRSDKMLANYLARYLREIRPS